MYFVHDERTDLAMERATIARERGAGQIPGMSVREETIEPGIKITRVQVTTPQAASSVGKPPGRYFTLECPALRTRNRVLLKQVAEVVSRELAELARLPRQGDVLVVEIGRAHV